ncbi:MAG: YdcF family protein [Verrucomicrobia bacterium]|nr:YdcF family protein [Verrucomicrobiota bacterium]
MISDVLRLFTPFLQPIGFVWLLQMLWTVYLLKRKRIREALFPAAMAALIWIIGGSPLPAYLIATLEEPYARPPGAEVPHRDVIVMLGGCARTSQNDPNGFNLHSSGDRFITALALARQNKARALVLGGGNLRVLDGRVSEGKVFTDWLTNLGLVTMPMFNLGVREDTRDEAEHLQALAKEKGWQNCLLITSAAHMKRADAIFKKLGVDATPIACDFEVAGLPGEKYLTRLVPGLQGFSLLGIYLHERVGWFVYRLRGWV